jgi:hypothetical protein
MKVESRNEVMEEVLTGARRPLYSIRVGFGFRERFRRLA